MPATHVHLYQESDGSSPVLLWLKELQSRNRRAFDKCLFLLDMLEQLGSELRRPRADYLRDGVYELRTEVKNVQYRILYGFAGKNIAVLLHALTKRSKVPASDIEVAAIRLKRFQRSPEKHTAVRDLTDDQEE